MKLCSIEQQTTKTSHRGMAMCYSHTFSRRNTLSRTKEYSQLPVHSFMSASAFAPRSCASQGGTRQRCLLLGRKAMTNLDSILKSRDITLLTKVHILEAIAFLVVMYRLDNWTINKAEHQRIDAFELWCWKRLLRVPWTARR